MNRLSYLFVVCASVVLCACTKEPVISSSDEDSTAVVTRAVVPEEFDWETVDWMPTPQGQTKIPIPWVGQGSLVGLYGLDVVNDYKKIDGWRLLYSTFSDTGSEPLVNPYFMLYNIYRGTLRVYLYVTTPFVSTSSYLQDGLSVVSSNGVSSNMLNYLGRTIIDIDSTNVNFNQIQPRPLNGAAPLATGRWYMMEYEIAYDPNISSLDCHKVQLMWNLDYVKLTEINIDGEIQGSINGTFGTNGRTNKFNDVLHESEGLAFKGSFAALGLDYLNNMKDDDTGKNKIGVSKKVFDALLSGASSAVSSFTSGLPTIAFDIFNAVFGGKNGASTQQVSLTANAEMKLKGEASESGSFPSMPISWWVPGSIIPSSVQGFVPLYNEPLGVFYWNGNNKVNVSNTTVVTREPDDIMNTGTYNVYHKTMRIDLMDYAVGLKINPYLLDYADVTVVSEDVIAVGYGKITDQTTRFEEVKYDNPYEESWSEIPNIACFLLKYLIKVQPKDGSPASYICKTFRLKENVTNKVIYE